MIGNFEKKKRIGKIGALVIMGIFVVLILAQPAVATSYQLSNGEWVGLGATDGRIVFHEQGTTDEIEVATARLGIGDTSPDFKLEVTGSSGDGYFGVSSTDAEGNNGNVFIIDTNGKVGIGTSSPSAKLDVHTSSGGAATIGDSSNTATGDYAVAMGSSNAASGDFAVAVGTDNVASGEASFTFGNYNTADGIYSFAGGWLSEANGDGSFAMGGTATADGTYSFALGAEVTASALYSYAIGNCMDGPDMTNNIESSLMIGFHSATPTLFVDGSSVGVATTSPSAKVHIVQTAASDAFRVDDVASDTSPFIINQDGNVGIGTASPRSTLSVSGGVTIGSIWSSSYAASASSLIVEGNVGIGETSPSAKLEIAGNILFDKDADRTISLQTPGGTSNGHKLTISAGDGLGFGLNGRTGGDLVLEAGDGAGTSGSAGGNAYLYGGAPGGDALDGNVILAHTGSALRGRVGIGTTSPDNILDIYGTSTQLRITRTEASDYVTFEVTTDGDLVIRTYDGGGSEGNIRLIPESNVGIGCTPDRKLHIYEYGEDIPALKLECDTDTDSKTAEDIYVPIDINGTVYYIRLYS